MAGVYGGSPYSRTLMTSNNVVELPVRQRTIHASPQHAGCYIDWRTFGITLGFLSAATCGLGIADVYYTYVTYMTPCSSSPPTKQGPVCDSNVLVFTWIAVGIWASIPVFIFALMCLCMAGRAYTRNMCVELLAFLCAIVFTSAMVALSAVEVWKGVGVYYWPASSGPDDIVKVALPLTIACAGFVEHIMCVIALYYFCCCHGVQSSTVVTSAPTVVRTMPAPQPQPQVVYQPAMPMQSPCPPKPSCQSCPAPRFPQNNFFTGGGYSGGGAGCTSCPRPITYNTQMAPNPAYNFYRS